MGRKIVITSDNHYDYTTEISNVHSEDRQLTITMVDLHTDITAADYLKPHPALFTFVDPCSFKVDYYLASSYGGDVSWYVNNEPYKPGKSGSVEFVNPGDYQIKVRTQSSANSLSWDRYFATTIEDNIEADVTTNATVVEYRLAIDNEISTESEPLVDEDSTYYSRGDIVTLTSTVTYSRVGAADTNHNITYTIVDPEGLSTVGEEIPLNAYGPLQFELNKLGVYTITTEVEDIDCQTTFVTTNEVETMNFIALEYLDCDNFELSNRSSNTTISYTVEDVAKRGVITQSGTLIEQQAEVLTFTSVSLYLLKVTYTRNELPVTETYVLNNYCKIEACFTSYIEDLLCAPEERCSPCPPESDLKQMFLFYNTYFMKVNNLFNENSFYTALDTEGLSEITTLKQLMDEMIKFCDRRSCTDSSTAAFSSSYQTQGPYDYVGKGTALDPGCKTCS